MAEKLYSNINSEKYWETRFSTGDWAKYEGDKQSIFFAEILLDLLPIWLVNEINQKKYEILDIGCAEGSGTNKFKQKFPNSKVMGIDFSKSAIETAQIKYPYISFMKADLDDIHDNVDIAIVSNVLEHVSNPIDTIAKLLQRVNKYLLILCPVNDNLQISEHVNFFNPSSFPIRVTDFPLLYFAHKDCRAITPNYWPGDQFLLVYSKEDYPFDNPNISDLSNISDLIELASAYQNIDPSTLSSKEVRIAQLRADLAEKEAQISRLEIELTDKAQMSESQTKFIEDREAEIAQLQSDLAEKKRALSNLNSNLESSQIQIGIAENTIDQLKAKVDQKERDIYQIKKKAIEQLQFYYDEIIHKSDAMTIAIMHTQNIMDSRKSKLFHLTSRIKNQLFSKSSEERKKFLNWLSHRSSIWTDNDKRFQPLYQVIDTLKSNDHVISPIPSEDLVTVPKEVKRESYLNTLPFYKSPFIQHLESENVKFETCLRTGLSPNALKIKQILLESNNAGVLVYPHVVHWEPFQTPQQLLRSFANLGWLCFFCEHESINANVDEIEKNIFLVHETDLIQALADTEVLILLTWLGSLPFVDQIRNKKTWYHIIDDLEIFPLYSEIYKQTHIQLLDKATWVSYVSKPLKEIVKSRADAVYLPNGVNPEELSREKKSPPKDLAPILQHSKAVIGYFGYIASWMDLELLKTISQARPNYDFVFLGDSQIDLSPLSAYRNLHFLGRKSYRDLPNYANNFDICMIPFKINTMMDKVSPIKFYEYCAYGKPIIATRMKELEPYEGPFISIVDNPSEFIQSLDEFLKPEVIQEASEKGPQIAQANSWKSRAHTMQDIIKDDHRHFPAEKYTKQDFLFFGIIDFDFRHQRPQHLASSYAQNGHRVFYVNVSHSAVDSVREIEPNLFIVNIKHPANLSIHITDWSDCEDLIKSYFDKLIRNYSIKDASIIVEYPNWVHIVSYLRERYGFKIFLDYLDDFTGFTNPNTALVKKNNEILLKRADKVIPSSQFLSDLVHKYREDETTIVRNGTEFSYFNKAYTEEINNSKPVIGYYGAIAHWFDVDKICYVADHMPDCELVLIGEVTAGREELETRGNIKLLGEKPYSEIAEHLKYFDVCLIPFDASTDLIKATNPVKFYEYLSAGKKIVATEIPELFDYKDKYVYLTNDNEKFVEYIRLCLEKKDILATSEECIDFARQNDWQLRSDQFAEIVANEHPLISIVVLTYNNLNYTKLCLDSITKFTAYPNYEIIIVDNNSTDNTKEYLELFKNNNPSKAKVILNATNLGFAGGNNIGIRESSGDYIMLLNNDTIVTRGWLTNLLKHLEQNPNLAMVGPVTNSIGNEAKIFVDYANMQELDRFAHKHTLSHQGQLITNPNVLALFCTLIRKEIFQKELLDEQFGIGMFEDDDLSYRVKKEGWGIAIAEDSYVHHFQRVSFRLLDEGVEKNLFIQNKQYFEEKWHTAWIKHNYRQGITWDTNQNTTELELFTNGIG